jgi:hypothetical protein
MQCVDECEDHLRSAERCTLLLSDGREYLTLIIELEEPPLLIRRMIICKSIFRG